MISGEVPAKKNSRIVLKNGKNIPSVRYKEWHEKSYIELLTQKRPSKALDIPISIDIIFQHGDLRRRDFDNGVNSIMDLLVDVGILQDDKWSIVKKATIDNTFIKNNPMCFFSINTI